jgi:hypothetical protein
MAFPLSPANNQTALVNGIVYQWNVTLGVWKRNGSVNSIEVGQLLLNSAQRSTTNGSGTLIVSGGAGITGNVYSGGIYITGSANGITFADGSVQTSAGASAATGDAAFAQANASNQLANSAFAQANAANSLAGSAYGQANAAFTQANAANQYANSAFAKANTVANDLANFSSLFAGIEATQNTRISNAESQTQLAFDKANSANVLAQAAFNTANTKFNTSGGTITGDTVVTGNLTITGATVYANTENLTVKDNIITLNSNVTGAPSLSAGIEVNRGSSTNTKLLWSEANTAWEFTNNGTTYDKIAGQTFANAAFAAANTNATNITILQGVDLTQNTNITNADAKAQAAFDKANDAYTLANTANTNASSGGGGADSFARQTANAAFTQANTATTLAQAAFNKANTSDAVLTSTVDTYTGDGSTVAYTLSVTPATINYTTAVVGGVTQPRSVYSVVGTTLTFTSAPANNQIIEVTTIGTSNTTLYTVNNIISPFLLMGA